MAAASRATRSCGRNGASPAKLITWLHPGAFIAAQSIAATANAISASTHGATIGTAATQVSTRATHGASLALLAAMLLMLVRLFAGPSLYDRVLALNAFGTKTVLLIAVMGYYSGRPHFLDLSLVYALINFIGTIAVLKFLNYAPPPVGAEE